MGIQDLNAAADAEQRRAFMRSLLRDLQAMEQMLEGGLFETGVRRIGAEQEVVLIDASCHPAPVNQEILEALGDEHFTTELARFNIEYNLDPIEMGGNCLSAMESQINLYLSRLRRAAMDAHAEPILTGILPSLEKDDLSLDNMTPMPRYRALNDALNRLRGGPAKLSLKGVDELSVTHDSIMLEACNTSFQVHFQVDPDDFVRAYNIAQAVAGPVMCASVNSPLLFGRRLWRETRIALFQQSVDTRQVSESLRESQARVSFGTHWVEDSVLELFKEDIARFRTIFADTHEEDPLAVLEAGGVPKLWSLRLHNGTVYRWNRPCYGVFGGKPHLRIENRILPSGPTPVDEIANAALWFGLMRGMSDRYGDVTAHMEFDDAAENFTSAARHGLEAQLRWIGQEAKPARELILKDLIPMAREGLRAERVDAVDIDRYLGVIEGRVSSGVTGAEWIVRNFGSLRNGTNRAERTYTITRAIAERGKSGAPVHQWSAVSGSELIGSPRSFQRVGQFMTTDLFTVNESDIVDLVASLMDWKHIRHIPVEDDAHRLVGVVSHRSLLRYLARLKQGQTTQAVPVSDIMQKNPVSVTPETPTLEAMRIMRDHRIGCLPVVRDEKLVGIVTEHDLVSLSGPLLERFLSGEGDADASR
ncbi:MAG: CBS domain-containing protein [Phycisphaerales bacterium]|nr:CBS domain-containing protein [Phycisphaerales bacterium]